MEGLKRPLGVYLVGVAVVVASGSSSARSSSMSSKSWTYGTYWTHSCSPGWF